MAFDYATAMAHRTNGFEASYDEKRAILYALAVGMARDPLDCIDLRYVYEADLLVLPSFASVMAWGAHDIRKLGVDYARVLHAEQKVTLHAPLPPRARLIANARTKAIYDKGPDKGALIVSQVDIIDRDRDDLLCTLEPAHFARGDGGFASRGPDSGPAPPSLQVPTRDPDIQLTVPTLPNAALLYRLLGDSNPLHIAPDIARAAGFERPILHGLCTYGICCQALVRALCPDAPQRMRSFQMRFSGPVIPGDTLRISLWRTQTGAVFKVAALERGVTVATAGASELTAYGQ